MPLLLRLALLAVLLRCQAQRAAAAHPNGTTPNSNSTRAAARSAQPSGAAATLSRRALQAGSWPAGAGGAVWGWGNNNNGRLGIASSSTADRNAPVELVAFGADNAVVVAGNEHAVGLKTNGQVWGWGRNHKGNLGVGGTTDRTAPVQVSVLGADNVMVDAGSGVTFVLKGTGTVWAAGQNDAGQLGTGSTAWNAFADAFAEVTGAGTDNVMIAATRRNTHVLKASGAIWAWGDNGGNGLGVPPIVDADCGTGRNGRNPVDCAVTPVEVTALGTDNAFISKGLGALTFGHVVKNSGVVWCWGRNDLGQLGLGHTEDQSSPVEAPLLGTDTAFIAHGGGFTVVLKDMGALFSFGGGTDGKLGLGTTTDHHSPVEISSLGQDNSAVAAGGVFVHVIKASGAIWGWGNGQNGKIGIGSTANQLSPVEVTSLGLDNAMLGKRGNNFGFALKGSTVYSACELFNGACRSEAPAAVCTRPADTTGYSIGAEQLDPGVGAFSVDVTCDTNYETTGGGPSATSCTTDGGPYALSGCALIWVYTAVAECRAESADFNCPLSEATYVPTGIGTWDVSAVTSFNGLFEGDTSFNVDISGWNTGSCTNMDSMFKGATSFDQDLSGWDVSQVITFAGMFRESQYNRPLRAWTTSSSTDMREMFRLNHHFNQDLAGPGSNWDTSSVTNMASMFEGATSFDQDLSDWNTNSVTDLLNMFYGSAMSYDLRAPGGPWSLSAASYPNHVATMYATSCVERAARCVVCTPPAMQTGYSTTNNVLNADPLVFDVSATCDSGYQGAAQVVACTADGDYTLEGCSIVCTRPADTTGYSIGAEQLDLAAEAFSVDVTCDTSYEGTPAATPCVLSGDYALSGCTEVVCTTPTDIPESLMAPVENQLNAATGFDVDVSCAAGYEGSPAAVSCAVSGPYTFGGGSCTAIICRTPDVLPQATDTPIETNLDLSAGAFSVSINCREGYLGTIAAAPCATSTSNRWAQYTYTGSCVLAVPCTVTGLSAPLNGALDETCADNMVLPDGDACVLTCDVGFNLVGSQPRCSSGVFSVGTVRCADPLAGNLAPCSEHGWSVVTEEALASRGVCGGRPAALSSTDCTAAAGMRSHSATVALCSQVGARLCTFTELDEFHRKPHESIDAFDPHLSQFPSSLVMLRFPSSVLRCHVRQESTASILAPPMRKRSLESVSDTGGTSTVAPQVTTCTRVYLRALNVAIRARKLAVQTA